MKVLVFLHGTVLVHKSAKDKTPSERILQVKNHDPSVKDYKSYIPVGRAVSVLQNLVEQGHIIIYLSSNETLDKIEDDKFVLEKYNFPHGEVAFRKHGESYANVAISVKPDVIIEDDCESIGGVKEMTYRNLPEEYKKGIKSIVVKEFTGIDGVENAFC